MAELKMNSAFVAGSDVSDQMVFFACQTIHHLETDISGLAASSSVSSVHFIEDDSNAPIRWSSRGFWDCSWCYYEAYLDLQLLWRYLPSYIDLLCIWQVYAFAVSMCMVISYKRTF